MPDYRVLLPAPFLQTAKCIACEHPVSGSSPHAMEAAMQSHCDFVNTAKDRTEDTHFELHRLAVLESA